MNIHYAPLSPESIRTSKALRNAVTTELDKKRQPGHYCEVWRNGGPAFVGTDAPNNNHQRLSATTEA